ncbi:MAG: large subunit ribosomal protein [Candidatus Parcubacteria bacterium]|jgi:large subunit ribosomal protein L6|nr:large subunit ribosomal protein [Candidatus Parcubacteria bacterium]
MSRLAKKPIAVPAKVTVDTGGGTLTVKGPKETLSKDIHSSIAIDVTPEGVMVTPKNNSKLARSLTGTYAAHVRAMVSGVETPWKKALVLKGVGYKVELKGKDLVFNVGFSHQVTLTVPEGLTATVEKGVIRIEGADKQRVGQFAAEVRDIKRPEPYLGKGIAYEGEVIRRKQGKKAV